MGFWGWTMMTVLWGGVIALIVWAIRSRHRSGPAASPLVILERRFAAGDIHRDEYEERRGLLKSK